ncbi:MAG: hypothetical protein J07HN4v3_02168 [Halonotius sp. J07HN4]|nr:MAG: hypothetical protein J07HN4v3_02168 [Halonotius sp. J07HN4]
MDAAILGTGAIGAISVPASKPPIEIVVDGRESVVREFVTDGSKPQVLSQYENRRLAERAVRKQLSNSRYPCAVVWETKQSVGGLLWNDQFKRLQVTYSELLAAWIVAPTTDEFMFCALEHNQQACRFAKSIQRDYEFKHLELRTKAGAVDRVIDHRFLRQSITDSGVQFSR